MRLRVLELRKSVWAATVLATFAFSNAAWAGQAPPGATGAIAGSVAQRQSSQPVPGAVVSLEGTSLTAVATATGRFRIDNVPPGSVMVVVRAPGFLDAHVGAVRCGPAIRPRWTSSST